MCDNPTKITEKQFFDRCFSFIKIAVISCFQMGKNENFCFTCSIDCTVNALAETIRAFANERQRITGEDVNEYLQNICENMMDNSPPTPEKKTDLKIVH